MVTAMHQYMTCLKFEYFWKWKLPSNHSQKTQVKTVSAVQSCALASAFLIAHEVRMLHPLSILYAVHKNMANCARTCSKFEISGEGGGVKHQNITHRRQKHCRNSAILGLKVRTTGQLTALCLSLLSYIIGLFCKPLSKTYAAQEIVPFRVRKMASFDIFV